MANHNGHLFRFRDPNDPNKWIDIPILYQTMYMAYLAYCEEHGIVESARLSEDAYYTTLGTLKSIADTLTGYGGTIPLSAGGTGIGVGTIDELLEHLGLVYDMEAVLNNTEINPSKYFPSVSAVNQHVDNRIDDVVQGVEEAVEALDGRITDAKDSITLASLGISSGTANPGTNTPGTIYIKYS